MEAQSKPEAQGSPGEYVAQEPVPGLQARQPMRVAAALQQEPARQAQVAFEEQDEPGAPDPEEEVRAPLAAVQFTADMEEAGLKPEAQGVGDEEFEAQKWFGGQGKQTVLAGAGA